eukprot:1733714-Rhodomonas_salina.2
MLSQQAPPPPPELHRTPMSGPASPHTQSQKQNSAKTKDEQLWRQHKLYCTGGLEIDFAPATSVVPASWSRRYGLQRLQRARTPLVPRYADSVPANP